MMTETRWYAMLSMLEDGSGPRHGMRNWPSVPSIALHRALKSRSPKLPHKPMETYTSSRKQTKVVAFGCDLDFLIGIRWQKSLKIINWRKIAAVNSAYYPICDLVISKTRWKCRVCSQWAFCTPGPEYIEQSLATGFWKFTWTSARSFVSMRWSYHVFQDSHGTHCGFASPKRWASYIKPKWFQFTLRQVIHWFTVSSFTSLNPSKLFLESAFGRSFFTASQVQLSRRASAKVPLHRSANWVVELPMNEYHTTTHRPVNHSGMKLGMVGGLVDYYMIWMHIFLEFLEHFLGYLKRN